MCLSTAPWPVDIYAHQKPNVTKTRVELSRGASAFECFIGPFVQKFSVSPGEMLASVRDVQTASVDKVLIMNAISHPS